MATVSDSLYLECLSCVHPHIMDKLVFYSLLPLFTVHRFQELGHTPVYKRKINNPFWLQVDVKGPKVQQSVQKCKLFSRGFCFETQISLPMILHYWYLMVVYAWIERESLCSFFIGFIGFLSWNVICYEYDFFILRPSKQTWANIFINVWSCR